MEILNPLPPLYCCNFNYCNLNSYTDLKELKNIIEYKIYVYKLYCL